MRPSLKSIAPEWFTLPNQEGEDEPVQFYLKPLDGMAGTSVLLGSYDPETGAVDGTGIIKAFRLGTKNWRNIEDGDNPGEQLAFSVKALAKIHSGWVMAVGSRVIEISTLSAGESKNSASPSSSPKI